MCRRWRLNEYGAMRNDVGKGQFKCSDISRHSEEHNPSISDLTMSIGHWRIKLRLRNARTDRQTLGAAETRELRDGRTDGHKPQDESSYTAVRSVQKLAASPSGPQTRSPPPQPAQTQVTFRFAHFKTFYNLRFYIWRFRSLEETYGTTEGQGVTSDPLHKYSFVNFIFDARRP